MKNSKRRTPQLRKRLPNRHHERRDAILARVIDVNRVLGSNLDSDTIWDALHDYFDLTFETTSFFIARYDYERERLTLPLVSEDGMRSEHEPIPVCGMSRAVVMHGVEFHVMDIEAEQERLKALGIEPDEREPGRWARSWLGVPLRNRQSEVIGLIALQNTASNSFDDDDLSLLMAIAAPLALALDNIRLIESERERRLIAGALLEIGQLSGVQVDYDDVLDRVLDELQRVVGYDSAAALLPPAGEEGVLIIGTSHDPETFVKGTTLHPRDFSPVAQSLSSRQPFVVADVERFAAWWDGDAPDAAHLHSWLIVPMTMQQKVGALILLGKLAPSSYTQKDASNAFALARQGAIALETSRLQAQTQINVQTFQQRARRAASINRITGVIMASLKRDEVFRMTAQLVAELFEVDHCGIVTLEPDADSAVLAAEYPGTGKVGQRIARAGNGTLDWLAQYGTALIIEDVAHAGDDATCAALQQMDVQSTLIAPLAVSDRLIGTLGVDMIRAPRAFTAEERETLMVIAGQVGIAIAHASLYEAALGGRRGDR